MFRFFPAIAFVLLFGYANSQPTSVASALDWAKKKCSDIGFKVGTERFGTCVLQLSKNEDLATAPSKNTPTPAEIRRQPSVPSALKTFKDCDDCPEMVVIPEGKFLMGSKDDPFAEFVPSKDEMPQHEVKIRSFSIGKFEITQGQWYSVMGTTPSGLLGRELPVSAVSWEDTQEFVKKLSAKTGNSYRLPSEAEWEYAARAGNQTVFPFGDSLKVSVDFGWSEINSNRRPQKVGLKQPNKFGIYDMQGNVMEWTQDCWNPNYIDAPTDGAPWITGQCITRVARGGSWAGTDEMMRSARRYSYPINIRYEQQGFRVVRDN
jgi:formylglycine-generating enzyme required for sulfatase activity